MVALANSVPPLAAGQGVGRCEDPSRVSDRANKQRATSQHPRDAAHALPTRHGRYSRSDVRTRTRDRVAASRRGEGRLATSRSPTSCPPMTTPIQQRTKDHKSTWRVCEVCYKQTNGLSSLCRQHRLYRGKNGSVKVSRPICHQDYAHLIGLATKYMKQQPPPLPILE